jgi:hypothetical protein
MTPPEGKAQGDAGEQKYNPETVDELVEQAKFHAEFEESRLHTNNQRAAWLLALDGVILGLAANQAREMLVNSSLLGSTGRWLAAASLLLAVVFVLASAGCALTVIFRTKTWAWDRREIEYLPSSESVTREKAEAQGRFLIGLTQRIRDEREGYGERRRWLERAFVALGIALIAVTVHIGVYSVRTVQSSPCSAAARSSSSLVAGASQSGRGAPVAMRSASPGAIEAASLSAESPFDPPKGGKCTR